MFHRHHNNADSWVFPKSTVNLGRVNEWTIWHELGHVISFRNGHETQDEFFKRVSNMAEAGGYTTDLYCIRDYCHRQYGIAIRWYTGRNPEYWADGFAVWVYQTSYSAYPHHWVASGRHVLWSGIMSAVDSSLRVSFP